MVNAIKQLDLESMPQAIRDWLASSIATYTVIEINNRLGLKDSKRQIIPSLIFWLATGETTPENFIAELSQELKINFPSAKNITAEIVEKLLRPIERALRTEIGVDISKILTTQPLVVSPAEPPTEEVPAPAPASIPVPTPIPTPIISKTPEIKELRPSTLSGVEEERPFIIHEETPTFTVRLRSPQAVRSPTGESPQAVRSPTGESPQEVPIKITPPPVRSKVVFPSIPAIIPTPTVVQPPEIPKKISTPIKPEIKETKMLPNITHKNSHRVVHYSNLISPL